MVIQTPNALFAAIARASSIARGSKRSSSTVSDTSPMRSASAASTMRPVNMMSNARDRPTQRGSNQLTPISQPDRPTRTKAALKSADRAAMRISAASASPRPAPLAGPLTAAITGWRNARKRVTSDAERLLARHPGRGLAELGAVGRVGGQAEVEARTEAPAFAGDYEHADLAVPRHLVEQTADLCHGAVGQSIELARAVQPQQRNTRFRMFEVCAHADYTLIHPLAGSMRLLARSSRYRRPEAI